MLKKHMLSALLLTSATVHAGNGCPASSKEECASLFAKQMTLIAKKMNTGMGPFRLDRASSEGTSVTMHYKGGFTKSDLDKTAVERNSTIAQFLDMVRNDFVPYQCDSPIRDLVSDGVEVRSKLSSADGILLDEFVLTGCPPKN